jgi:hypothetical protein
MRFLQAQGIERLGEARLGVRQEVAEDLIHFVALLMIHPHIHRVDGVVGTVSELREVQFAYHLIV